MKTIMFLLAVASQLTIASADTGVIPPTEGRNAQLVIHGEKVDACLLAVHLNDRSNELYEKVFSLYEIPVARRPETWADEALDGMRELRRVYGLVEITSAICAGRPVVEGRIAPEDR